MPDSDGLEALDKIHREVPETRVVMLSTYDNPTYVARAVALGRQRLRAQGRDRQQLISDDHRRGRQANRPRTPASCSASPAP